MHLLFQSKEKVNLSMLTLLLQWNIIQNHTCESSSSSSELGLSLLCSKIYLLFLPKLPKIFTHYYYVFYSHSTTNHSFLFYCVNDIITMQEWLYIIYIANIMFNDCFNRMFDCSIRVSRYFCKPGGKAQQTFGRGWALPGVPFVFKLLYLVFHTFQLF